MRVYSVLYFTDNLEKYQTFIDDCQDCLSTAANKATEVILLESFKHNEPLFPSISSLFQFLENYKHNLSDLTIIVDSEGIIQSNSARLLRALMIEYPEVKFLFDGCQSPRNVIFSGEAVVLEHLSLSECERCLKLLDSSIDSASNKVVPKFLSGLQQQEGKDWSELREVLSLGLNETISVTELMNRIRDVKPQLSRTCAKKHVDDRLLKMPNRDSNLFILIVHTRDNLFDASNVRYAIKQWQYAHLRVNAKNFDVVQSSRRDHLAYCVEEEHGQNRFNSYCLFANGFRVLPITSATELCSVTQESGQNKDLLIVRDYDLQFFDQGESNESINVIRGFRDNFDNTWTVHLAESPYWKNYYVRPVPAGAENQGDVSSLALYHLSRDKTPLIQTTQISGEKGPVQIESEDSSTVPIYYVSKGTNKVSLFTPMRAWILDIKNRRRSGRISCRFESEDSKFKLFLPGIQKPVSGIYYPFQRIPEVRKRYLSICKDANKRMDTTREAHNHGTALDVYATVKSLLRRSEKYYQRGKYVHAAILANETIEYLNGFHESILLQAYRLLAISENAIAINTVGGDEASLKEDTLFRISKIENEIRRILRRDTNEKKKHDERLEYKYNILNQIYSNCRHFCKEREYLAAEDCFISAMARVNEGFTPSDIWKEIQGKLRKIRNSWEEKKNDISIDAYE